MKRLSIAAGALFAAWLVIGLPSVAAAQQVTLLHVNDSHSHLAAWGPKDANLDGTLGGLPKAAAIVAAEKAVDPGALFVHAGDFMNGDLFFNEHLGVPELQLLRSLGLDALVPGNRDFQQGSAFLAGVLSAAWSTGGGVPVLGTNIVAGDHPLSAWLTPTLIREVNGVKVGLLGLTRRGPLASPEPVVILDDLPAVAVPAVQAVREAGAQVVICLTHFGLSRARTLAQTVGGIDVIVNADDHVALPQPEAVARPGGGTTFIVSAGSYYRWVGRLRLSVSGTTVNFVDFALIGADSDTLPLPPTQMAIDALEPAIVARYGDVFRQPLAWAGQDITAGWDPDRAKRDTPLGNLFTDAYRAWMGADVAIEAMGFLNDPLPAGVVVGADVFRAMSLSLSPRVVGAKTIVRPARLATFRMSGAALLAALETTIGYGGDYFPQVSGVRLAYHSGAASGHRVVADSVHVNGHLLEPDQLYTVTATEYVYGALVSLQIPVQDVRVLPVLAFEAARAFIQSRGELGPAASNRIRDVAATPSSSSAPR